MDLLGEQIYRLNRQLKHKQTSYKTQKHTHTQKAHTHRQTTLLEDRVPEVYCIPASQVKETAMEKKNRGDESYQTCQLYHSRM